MNSCGSVSMDRYWSYVATPLFYTVIGFGVYTLFVTQDIQVSSTKDISKAVESIRDAKGDMESKGADKRDPMDVTRNHPSSKGSRIPPPPSAPPPSAPSMNPLQSAVTAFMGFTQRKGDKPRPPK